MIVCPEKDDVVLKFGIGSIENILFAKNFQLTIPGPASHAPISVFIDNKPVLYDFSFNGWGLKLAADLDNQISRKLFDLNLFDGVSQVHQYASFYSLEGGNILNQMEMAQSSE